MDNAFGPGGFGRRQAGGAHSVEHIVAIGKVTDGEHEGLLAGDLIAAAAADGVEDGLPDFGQREARRRDGAVLDELGEKVRSQTGRVGHGTPKSKLDVRSGNVAEGRGPRGNWGGLSRHC